MGLKIVLENFESADPRQINRVITMLQCLQASFPVITGAGQTCASHEPVMPIAKEEIWTPHTVIVDDITKVAEAPVPAPIEAFKAPEAPVIPPAPPAPPMPPISGIDVDITGLPWDGRIHASSRAKTTEGLWRARRGVDKALVAQVEAQLKQTMAIPVVAAPAPIEPPPPFPFPMPVLGAAPIPPVPAAPVVPPPAVVVAPPPFVASAVAPASQPTTATASSAGSASGATTSPSSTVTFPALMQKITAAFQQETDKTAFQGRIQEAIQSVGLPSLPMLASRQDLVAAVATKLGLAL